MTMGAASHEEVVRQLEAVLAAMLARKRGAFVVCTLPGSGRFVQYSGSREEPLVLDLPVEQLNRAERGRAQALFRDLGGEASSGAESFQLALGRDHLRGAEAGARVLLEVLWAPSDVALEIEAS